MQFFATPPVDGAFANFVTIHEDFAFALPDALGDEEGALMEPLSVGLWACWKGRVGPDTSVLVTGAVPMAALQSRELWLTGTFRYAGTYPAAIALAADGRVDLTAIVTGRFPLDEAEAALRAGHEDLRSIKPVVVPGAASDGGRLGGARRAAHRRRLTNGELG